MHVADTLANRIARGVSKSRKAGWGKYIFSERWTSSLLFIAPFLPHPELSPGVILFTTTWRIPSSRLSAPSCTSLKALAPADAKETETGSEKAKGTERETGASVWVKKEATGGASKEKERKKIKGTLSPTSIFPASFDSPLKFATPIAWPPLRRLHARARNNIDDSDAIRNASSPRMALQRCLPGVHRLCSAPTGSLAIFELACYP